MDSRCSAILKIFLKFLLIFVRILKLNSFLSTEFLTRNSFIVPPIRSHFCAVSCLKKELKANWPDNVKWSSLLIFICGKILSQLFSSFSSVVKLSEEFTPLKSSKINPRILDWTKWTIVHVFIFFEHSQRVNFGFSVLGLSFYRFKLARIVNFLIRQKTKHLNCSAQILEDHFFTCTKTGWETRN